MISCETHVHRHLDWRPVLDWLGYQPFWVLEKGRIVKAALACPPDPPGVAWIRLFTVSSSIQLQEAWTLLFTPILRELSGPSHTIIVGLALQAWFAEILVQNNFVNHQDIVVLEYPALTVIHRHHDTSVKIRKIKIDEMDTVVQIDNLAFEPVWQLSQDAFKRACQQASYFTVAEVNGRVVGYQLTTGGPLNAHLARLAVDPQFQHNHIGYSLVEDMLQHFLSRNITQITVNTQHDNHASLALYQNIGFRFTGERFPTYIFDNQYQKLSE